MAVIRQQTQVFNKPVGVRRINTGEAELWEQVAATADEFTNRAYKKAAIEAEQAGKMKAMSVDSGEIVGIDPETNKPIAFKAPSNYGSIAASAYQDVITRRFEESVDDELKAQGSYYAKNATSADEYKIAISGHVGNMIKAGGDDTYFSRYIEEAGQAYVDSTYVTMKAKETEAIIQGKLQQDFISGIYKENEIQSQINAGIDINLINKNIANEITRNTGLLKADYLTDFQYRDALNRLTGMQSLASNAELTRHYSELDEMQRAKLLSSLDNPNEIEDESIKKLVINALVSNKSQTISDGLKAVTARQGDAVLAAVDVEVSNRISKINKNMSPKQISDLANDIEDPDIRKETARRLVFDFIDKRLDLAANNSQQAVIIIDELKNSEPNPAALIGALRESYNKNSTNVQELPALVNFIIDMTDQERQEFASDLSSRLPAIRSRESDIANTFEKNTRGNIANIITLQDYNSIVESIKNNKNLINKDTLLGVASNKFADVQAELASGLHLKHDEILNVQNALGDTRGINLLTTIEEKAAYEYYKVAHDINPASINSSISNRLKAAANMTIVDANKVKHTTLINALNAGSNVPYDDLQFLEKRIMGDTVLLDASNIDNFTQLTGYLKNGVMFPAVKSFLERSVTSMNEEEVAAAAKLFEENSRVKITSDGETHYNDMLSGRMKPEAYSMLSAAVTTARAEKTTPFLILAELNAYEGNLEADALNDLATESSAKSLIRYFDDRNISPNYKKELAIAIKMQKARGIKITPEVIEGIIDNYTEQKLMYKDDNIVSSVIDGKSAFALMSHLKSIDIVNNRKELTFALSESDPFSPLLKGGTSLDQTIQTFRDLIGFEATGMVQAIYEEFTGGYQAKSNLTDRELVRRGFKILNTHIKWQPDEASFANGVPKWYAGFINEFGKFQNISIDGVDWTLERTSDYTDEFRSIAHKTFIKSLRSSDPKTRGLGYINYHATLDNIEYIDFKDNDLEYEKLLQTFGSDAKIENLFNKQKELYLKERR